MKKPIDLKEFEEGILSGDKAIRETYPLGKDKLIIQYTLSTMTWRGDAFEHAEAEISYCCDRAKALVFVNNAIDPANFLKMFYQDKLIQECPFCGAGIEIKQR